MSRILRANALVAVAAVLVITMTARADPPDSAREQKTPKKPPVHVTISEETTRITGPLREDGYVDYVAALNELAGRDVTPENNAAVLFWQAMGPREIVERDRKSFFAMLGIPVPPESGDYFVLLDDHVRKTEAAKPPKGAEPPKGRFDEIHNRLNRAMRRPWSKKEFPVLADWLAVNEKPLKLLVEASRRPSRYDPLIVSGEGVDGMLAVCSRSGFQLYRSVARALTARAMLKVAEGRIDSAWSDLLACHRLAGQGATMIAALVAMSIDGLACLGDEGLLQHVRLTADQAANMREDLRKLGPMPKMRDKMDTGERYAYLDSVGVLARDGAERLEGLVGSRSKMDRMIEALAKRDGRQGIDWDLVLRMGNSWYDRMVDACGKPTRAERKETVAKIIPDLERQMKKASDLKFLALAVLVDPRKAVSRRIGLLLAALLLPATGAAIDAEDHAAMLSEITHLGFALAAYRSDHDSYPARLDELVPKYVAEVPCDIFTAGPLHYKQRPKGYVLYSVGRNGKDDDGLRYEDQDDYHDDDIAIRVPARKRKAEKP